MRTLLCLLPFAILLSCQGEPRRSTSTGIDSVEFERLLFTVSEGWAEDDAERAASVFAEDAIYVEPPAKQLYRGRQEIFEFFGGESGRGSAMAMSWHAISFDEASQQGAAEFTFAWGEGAPDSGQVHGMVSILVRDGLIVRWREYFYESELDWEQFTAASSLSRHTP